MCDINLVDGGVPKENVSSEGIEIQASNIVAAECELSFTCEVLAVRVAREYDGTAAGTATGARVCGGRVADGSAARRSALESLRVEQVLNFAPPVC
jgi:predicted butyrate kinase (DUF1464 family)